jgi:hypothetical protein
MLEKLAISDITEQDFKFLVQKNQLLLTKIMKEYGGLEHQISVNKHFVHNRKFELFGDLMPENFKNGNGPISYVGQNSLKDALSLYCDWFTSYETTDGFIYAYEGATPVYFYQKELMKNHFIKLSAEDYSFSFLEGKELVNLHKKYTFFMKEFTQKAIKSADNDLYS